MLEGIHITKKFGGLTTLSDIDFSIRKSEIVGLIGPNGAGKTTLFNLISGVYQPTSGSMKFDGIDITGLKPHKICRLGISRTYQTPKPFQEMTVRQNVMVGESFGGGGPIRSDINILEFLGISDISDDLVKHISHGKRKLVEIAAALATRPKIILLDEIAAGLNPTEVLRVMKMIREIRDELGVAVFWIEHVIRAVMEVVDRIIVLHHTRKIAEGRPDEIANDERVLDAYLGEGA